MHREPDVGVSASSLLSFLHGEACAEHGDVLDLAWLQLYPLESQRWALRDGGGGGELGKQCAIILLQARNHPDTVPSLLWRWEQMVRSSRGGKFPFRTLAVP